VRNCARARGPIRRDLRGSSKLLVAFLSLH
jgi:hypothetical protein